MMDIADPYADFARRYDRFYGTFGTHDPIYIQFFHSLFEKYKVQAVLDCACGTGNDLHLFKILGFEAYGSDISEAMLVQARENLGSLDLDIPLMKADFRELPRYFSKRFDAIVCLSTSLPHLLEEDQIISALIAMREVLRDSGILVLTQGMCDRQLKERPRYVSVINNQEFTRLFVMDYGQEKLRIDILDFTHDQDQQAFDRASVEYRIILYDDYEKLLTEAGFSRRHYYGNFQFEPYDKETSNRLILVAQR